MFEQIQLQLGQICVGGEIAGNKVEKRSQFMENRGKQPLPSLPIVQGVAKPVRALSDHNSSKFLKGVKLDLPKYNGETNPVFWMNQVEQVLWCHGITIEDRVVIATFHLEGHGQIWYSVLFEEGELPWEEFRDRLICRFGPSQGWVRVNRTSDKVLFMYVYLTSGKKLIATVKILLSRRAR